MLRPVLSLGAVTALALLAAACGDDGGAAAPPATSGCRMAEAGSVTIVADNLAWDTDCLAIPADTVVSITIDNQDTGVNHNLRVEDLPDGDVATKLEAGPVVQRLELSAPAGTYRFVCDIHPNMVGSVVATDP